MKKLILFVLIFLLTGTAYAYDSAYTGAQIDAEVARSIGRNTTVADPGSDTELVTEQAVREAIAALSSVYQPLESTLTDIADGTITENLVNTANPWADNEMADAHSHAADSIDAITEIAAALKSGADTSLITGTAGTSGNCVEWDANGDAIDAGSPCGTGSGIANIVEDTTPQLGGDLDMNGNVINDATGISDDDCTGDQGKMWWDSTDNQWEFCNANSGTPIVVGSGSGGSAITLDLGDDGGDDSTDLTEIAPVGDAAATIFNEVSADKLEIDTNIAWPSATLAATITVADNESTNETNAILFTPGGDLDGGDLAIESDGDLTYNPSTGTFTALNFATSAADGSRYSTLPNNTAGNEPAAATVVTGIYNFGTSPVVYLVENSVKRGALAVQEDFDTWAELPAVTSAYILVGNGSNQPAAVAVSGDSSIDNTGAVTNTGIQNSTSDFTLTAGQLGIQETDDQIVFHGGSAGEVQGEAAISLLEHISVPFDPSYWYDQESTYRALPLFTVGDDFPEGFTITEWQVTYVGGDPTTELDADIMCDTTPDYNPAAGATVMDVIDTTAGTSTADTGFDSATCANGGKVYVRFGADPTDDNVIVHLEVWGYAEED